MKNRITKTLAVCTAAALSLTMLSACSPTKNMADALEKSAKVSRCITAAAAASPKMSKNGLKKTGSINEH